MQNEETIRDKKKPGKIQPQLPKGFSDLEEQQAFLIRSLCRTLEEVYSSWGFDLLETPAFEYTEALGQFLPDIDRPGEGVFSLQDDDSRWMSLRYDLTAPLARYVAQNYDRLPKPYRSYRCGYVFRNEKPGAGRFRQFIQCDVDTVGTEHPLADAEVCLMASTALTRLGLSPSDYTIKLNNRKIVDALLAKAGVTTEAQRLVVMRALDKYDRLGIEGVRELLGRGRTDLSGDFTKGADLSPQQAALFLDFLKTRSLEEVAALLGESPLFLEGVSELSFILECAKQEGQIGAPLVFDPSVVRGLAYYTGPVFEAELLSQVRNEEGELVRFGAIGGGGRYDGLVARFHRENVPATGFSIGVSRLCAALSGNVGTFRAALPPPVVVLVLEPDRRLAYQDMVQNLRRAGIRAEMYLGSSGLKAQMKYADRRGASFVILQGEEERLRGEVQIKDLTAGLLVSAEVSSRADWLSERASQVSVKQEHMIETLKNGLKRLGWAQ